MRPGARKQVQALKAFRDATVVPQFEPAVVASLAPLSVSWRGGVVAAPYPVGLVLTVGQAVVLVVPPTGVPFVGWALTGP